MNRIPYKSTFAGVGLVTALMVLNVILSCKDIKQVNEDAGWVVHTHEVRDLTSELLLTLVDAETGQRGFLLTGKDEFLQPYDAALGRLDEHMAQLKDKTKDNEPQQENLRNLKGMVEVELALLKQGIKLRRQKADEAQLFLEAKKGKEQMDSIRTLVAEMKGEEDRLLKVRMERATSAYRGAVMTELLTGLLGLGAIVAFVSLLRRNLLLRAKNAASLFRERERLRVTLASIGDAVIATDAEGRVTFLNAVAQTMTGWKPEDAIGTALPEVFKIVNEQTRQPVENPAAKAQQTGVIIGLANHTVLINKDGTEYLVDDSAAPIRDAKGKIIGVVLVFRDIGERRRAEAALAERVQLLALGADVGMALTQGKTLEDSLQRCAGSIVEHLDGAFARIWTLNPKENVLELQASAGLYTHLDGAHGRVPVGQLKIGLIAQERKPHLTNAVLGDSRVPDQEWARREGMVAFAGYPLVVEDRLVGVVAMFARHSLSPHPLAALASVASEIALGIERKRAEQEVARLLALEQERSQRLRQVAAASLTINSATSWTSIVDVIRAEARRIIGARDSDVCLQAEEDPLPLGTLTVPLIGQGGRPLGHIHLTGKAEGQFTADDEAILTQLAHMAAVAFDNARLYEELRDGDRRKDEFLAILAHELRNPLAPIRNSLQIMRLAGNNPTAVENSRAMIERQVQQMVRLVDDLLDLSRISRGKMHLQLERVDLTAIIHNAVEASRPLIEHSGHELTVRLPPEPVFLTGDPTRLAQIFLNLLNNAAKYTDRGGHLWLTAECESAFVTLRVRDDGVGIPEEMLARIFEMFTQVDNSLERAQGGLGIGLTLVKRLVELHGGKVEAHSEGPGKGSEFVVHLPIALEGEKTAEPAQDDGLAKVALRSPRRIVVVDDNRDAVDSLALMLRIMGNDIRTAGDGLEAVKVAESFQPDIVLLDLGLPRLNGFEAARRIRGLPGGKAIVLVAVTGWGQEEDRRRSREAGFDHHLVKPVDPVALERLLAGLEAPSG